MEREGEAELLRVRDSNAQLLHQLKALQLGEHPLAFGELAAGAMTELRVAGGDVPPLGVRLSGTPVSHADRLGVFRHLSS